MDGKEYKEDIAGGFNSWYCYDLVNLETLGKGPIRLELGLFGDPMFSSIGYLLYDGGYSGQMTVYQRDGLEHRWDWGPKGNEYAFIIKTDGTGLYFDFTVEKQTEPRQFYSCKKQ